MGNRWSSERRVSHRRGAGPVHENAHRMLLYYHKDPLGNFGDDLNPWLWERVLPGQFNGELAHDPKGRDRTSDGEALFVGIGTLLNGSVPPRVPKIVFGSGTGYGDPPHLDATWDIRCVRGPLTARALGLAPALAVTDPAVLVRTLDLGLAPEPRDAAYMPHCGSARAVDWRRICEAAGLRYIDPQWPVQQVLDGIRASRMLFTEALHGAIVADALRIPWVPIAASPSVLAVKWHDWCQSVGLDYAPQRLPAVWGARNAPALARLRSAAKGAAARMLLQSIVRRARPALSAQHRLDQVTAELQERIAAFRQRYALGG